MNLAKKLLTKINESRVIEDNDSNTDQLDRVTLDVPSLIRLLEIAREDIKSDDELHSVISTLLVKSKDVEVITMKEIEPISGLLSMLRNFSESNSPKWYCYNTQTREVYAGPSDTEEGCDMIRSSVAAKGFGSLDPDGKFVIGH